MATTQIRGNTQIINDTIVDAQINSAAAIATTKLADGPDFIKRTGTVAFTANQSLGGNKITSLADPTAATDAATKSYVDGIASGLDVKNSVRAATTANITLSGAQTIDGVSVVSGDRVLVKNQTTGSQNGIYDAAVGSWARSSDADTSGEFNAGAFTFVSEGTTNGDTGWVLTTDDPITLGTTSLTFAQFSSSASIIPGSGLDQTGNTFFIGDGAGILVNADSIEVELATDPGLEFDAVGVTGKLRAKVLSTGGIQRLSTGLSLLLDGTSLSTSASGVKVNSAITLLKTDYVVRETPSGTVNGSNVTFTLASTPVSGSEMIFLNGLLQDAGGANDYTISSATITFNTAPLSGDKIRVTYLK